jgi:type VI secretion system secreted protein VgrG
MKPFEVHSGPFQHIAWTLLSIVGEEAISELFRFVITIEARHDDLTAAAGGHALEAIDRGLVGQQVIFRLRANGPPRFGIIATARVEATTESGGDTWTKIAVEVVPRAWLLTQRRNSRIFMGVYVHMIVSYVLNESGVSHRFQLDKKYPRRVYCTQYDETDWEFITRLLAEEGILFFFEHPLDFTGGPVPEPEDDTSDWTKRAQIVGGISSVVGVVGGLGDNMALDSIGLAASAGNMVADLMKPVVDEEDDKPLKPGNGCAGPAGWANTKIKNPLEPTAGTDVLAFIDCAPYAVIPSPDDADEEIHLSLHDASGMENSEELILTELWPARRLRAKQATVRDFDFRRPMLLLEADAKTDVAVPGDAPLEVYAHHGEYEKPEVSHEVAKRQLEQHRADAATLEGRGHCSRLLAGGTFRVKNAHEAHLHDRDYAVVRVRHELYAPRDAVVPRGEEHRFEALARGCARAIHEALHKREPIAEDAISAIILAELGREAALRPLRTYKNSFTCVPSRILYRPPRPPPLVRNAVESAIVVGPRGLPPPAPGPADPNDPTSGDAAKEIYTDKYGRVKVQFHWDRDGELDEHSSCWVRVAQTWAGAGFGFQFIPRVGMEVLVGFLRGDPDRPVILGSVYNATHATPEPVPQRSTRSGIRTQSSPGGGGFNELSFEDARGVERINIHAQKDFEETVNDTHTLNVKNNQKITVAGNQQTDVGGDRVALVGGNEATIVGGNASEQVRGNRTVNVVMSETVVVGGNATRSVDGLAVETVKSDALTMVEGDHNLAVHGNSIVQIGGKDADTKSAAVTYVQGKSFHTASDGAIIRVEKAKDGAAGTLRLECGESFIEIGQDKITLSAKSIEGLGSDKVKLASKDSHLALDQDSATMQSKAASMATPDGSKMGVDGQHASVTAPGSATTKSKKVQFQSGDGAGNQDQPKKDAPANGASLTLRFFHGGGGAKPIGNTKIRVVVDDQVIEGSTTADEQFQLTVPESAKVAFVTLWANLVYPTLYPNGPLQWLVHLVPDQDVATSAKGARIRLRNLGYEPGTKLDVESFDDATARAILEFQLDREVPPVGELDHVTQKKLFDVYGS